MTNITMPSLSDSMEEGTILRWLKEAGETVAEGEELVEIETDKATMTYESPAAGILGGLVSEGGSHPVGSVIATVDAVGAATDGDAPAIDEQPRAPVPAPASLAPSTPAAPIQPNGADANGLAAGSAVRATPLARRIAAVHGVDLAAVSGTGPRGRVTRFDVVEAAGLAAPAPLSPPAPRSAPAASLDVDEPVPAAVGDADKTIQELTRTQQVIARRMAQSKATVPHFQVQTEAVLDALLELRVQLKAQTDQPPSINDFIVKACALALREFPLANGSYREDRFELHHRVNVGIAVATDDALIVPTVVDADLRSLGAIARDTRRLATAVREGTITPAELSGATFTVSNLGMYGMTAIAPVVNTPQAAILGVGKARPALARIDGEIIERQLMTLTLSCDHRILYGASAAEFLSRVRELLETPLRLAL